MEMEKQMQTEYVIFGQKKLVMKNQSQVKLLLNNGTMISGMVYRPEAPILRLEGIAYYFLNTNISGTRITEISMKKQRNTIGVLYTEDRVYFPDFTLGTISVSDWDFISKFDVA